MEELGELSTLSYLLGLLCLPRVPGKKKKSIMYRVFHASPKRQLPV